jgi:ribosome-binding protein aMBF1 (putative translation factor)
MIRNEQEYQSALSRVEEEKKRLEEQKNELANLGLNSEEIERGIAPFLSFHLQLVEEIEHYERLMRGESETLENLQGLGQLLVGLRIARGISQRELARRLDIAESQVSRDERNEYHGISVERASRVLQALGARLVSQIVATQSEAS